MILRVSNNVNDLGNSRPIDLRLNSWTHLRLIHKYPATEPEKKLAIKMVLIISFYDFFSIEEHL